jgi:hypothetical protein
MRLVTNNLHGVSMLTSVSILHSGTRGEALETSAVNIPCMKLILYCITYQACALTAIFCFELSSSARRSTDCSWFVRTQQLPPTSIATGTQKKIFHCHCTSQSKQLEKGMRGGSWSSLRRYVIFRQASVKLSECQHQQPHRRYQSHFICLLGSR